MVNSGEEFPWVKPESWRGRTGDLFNFFNVFIHLESAPDFCALRIMGSAEADFFLLNDHCMYKTAEFDIGWSGEPRNSLDVYDKGSEFIKNPVYYSIMAFPETLNSSLFTSRI